MSRTIEVILQHRKDTLHKAQYTGSDRALEALYLHRDAARALGNPRTIKVKVEAN